MSFAQLTAETNPFRCVTALEHVLFATRVSIGDKTGQKRRSIDMTIGGVRERLIKNTV